MKKSKIKKKVQLLLLFIITININKMNYYISNRLWGLRISTNMTTLLNFNNNNNNNKNINIYNNNNNNNNSNITKIMNYERSNIKK
jgi:hypothetical protein